MLLSKEVEVKIVGRNVKYYEEKGYKIPKYYNKKEKKYCFKNGTIIRVNVKDLKENSHVDILVECDYCKNQYYVRKDAYFKQKENDINKDCCKKCTHVKNKELNLLRYGVENQYQRPEIIEKIKNINIEKYGVNHPMKNKEIQIKSMQTMSRNNGVQTSRQQLYLSKLLDWKLNYLDKTTKYYSLDMAIKEEKIFLEYDGSGHDLQVKFGNLTVEEFKQKEIIRCLILKREGWKEIRIKSLTDKIPSDSIIFNMIEYAKTYLNSGHSWIHFDIDKSIVKSNLFENHYDYGKLRKIKDKDVL